MVSIEAQVLYRHLQNILAGDSDWEVVSQEVHCLDQDSI